MSKNKILAGTIGIIIGYTLFSLLVDFISKPSNVSLAFKPIDSLQTYFFSISFTLGPIGLVLASLLLIGFLVLFYFIGAWGYKTVLTK